MPIDHLKAERLSFDCEQLVHQRFGLYQAVQDTTAGIRDLKGQLQQYSSNLWNLSHGIDVLLTDDAAQRLPAEAKIARRIKVLERERDVLLARSAEMEKPLRDAVALVDSCRNYIAANPTGEGMATSSAAQPAGPVDLAEVRAANAAFRAQRAEVAGATYHRSEAFAAVHAELTAAAAEGAERMGQMIKSGRARDALSARHWSLHGSLNLMPLLAALLGPDQIMAALMPHIESMPPSIPAPDRVAMLADLDAKILALEEVDEAEILRREALGEKITRRGDADPAVVLRLREH